MEALSYSSSDHVHEPGAATPGLPGSASPAEPAGLSYTTMNEELPQGAADHAVPDTIRQLRSADEARKLFSAQQTYKDAIPDLDQASPNQRVVAAEWREVFADMGMAPNDAGELVKTVFGLQELPTAETLSGWERQAIEQLRNEFGPRGWREALTDAQRLAQRDPRVAQWLELTGLGSHPKFVLILSRLARQERAHGRL